MTGDEAPLKERKAKVSAIQDAVLGDFLPGEFRLTHRFSSLESFGGWASAQGLERLTKNPKVRRVGTVPNVSRGWGFPNE